MKIPSSRRFRNPSPGRFRWLVAGLILAASSSGYGFDKVSLREYPTLSLPVPSKMDVTKLPPGKTFQVNHPEFVLQFFFNHRDIFGFILKRNRNYGILVHWCFFRTCEDSPHDLKEIIARPGQPPFDQNFFSVKFPRLRKYDFQGLEFLAIP